jgi:LacI family transcriptional regulator
LTTVRLPIRDMGRAAAALLLLDTGGAAQRQYASFTPRIVIRGSAAPLREA